MTYVPLTITAHLASGFAIAHPWGIALDGLLAAELWQSGHPDLPHPADTDTPPDLELPLARCDRSGPDLWHWAATCSYPSPGYRSEVRYHSHSLDQTAVARLAASMPASLPTRQGRYRNRWMPTIVTLCSTVTWSAIGDADRIRDLLRPVTAIGKHRNRGEGTVLRWTIEPSEQSSFAAGHLHPDGSIGRPLPAGCVPSEVECGPPALAGLRPPYMHPGRQEQLHLPPAIDAR